MVSIAIRRDENGMKTLTPVPSHYLTFLAYGSARVPRGRFASSVLLKYSIVETLFYTVMLQCTHLVN